MNKENIDEWIAKFYEAKTSTKEEQILKDYFNQNEVSDKYLEYKNHFQFLNYSRKITLSKTPEEIFDTISVQKNSGFPKLWYFKVAAAIVLLLVAGGGVFLFLGDRSIQNKTIEISSGKYEQKTVELPDGSNVTLNAASKITYPEHFAGELRSLRLEGEAFFTIKSDKNRPFVIHTFDVVTKVLGTSFNLRAYENEENIEIVLISGLVEFADEKDGEKSIYLSPGNAATANRKNKSVIKSENYNPNVLAWKTGRLVFKDAPLSEVIETLNRCFDTSIHLQREDLSGCRFKGTFHESNIEDVLKVIAFTLNLKMELKSGTYLLSGAGCK